MARGVPVQFREVFAAEAKDLELKHWCAKAGTGTA
jgi:hypothetical protein